MNKLLRLVACMLLVWAAEREAKAATKQVMQGKAPVSELVATFHHLEASLDAFEMNLQETFPSWIHDHKQEVNAA